MAAGKYLRKEKRKKPVWPWLAAVLALALVITAVCLWGRGEEPVLSGNGETQPSTQDVTTDPSTQDATTDPSTQDATTAPSIGATEPYVTEIATVGVTGDILMHNPVLKAALKGDTYDFRDSYEYIAPYYEKFDFMVANLEVTLGGTEAGAYQGYPTFNCPDEVVDALKEAGVDMLLTANNHTYDTGKNGLIRTQQVIKEKGLLNLGTVENAGDRFWRIEEIGGIRVGMVCYTYESGKSSDGRKQLNGITLAQDAQALVSSFSYDDLPGFYATVEEDLEGMLVAGAEATMVFIHWGNEYQLSPNDDQKKIAQHLCYLGVDVIVGGHPHVIQPFEVINVEGHTTYCIYSVGNAISNQSRDSLKSYSNSKYTEDGMIFGVEFQKWNDGTVEITNIKILPTWVNREVKTVREYDIIPLDVNGPAWTSYDVGNVSRTYESYERTMSILGKGYNECLEKLGLPTVPMTHKPAA